MLATCFTCQKSGDYWEMRSLPEPVFLNGKELYGSFTYSKYFCPLKERKIRDNYLPENKERILIVDCLKGNQEIVRDKIIPN